MDINSYIQDGVVTIVMAILGIIFTIVLTYLGKFKTWIVNKVGAQTYNRALEVAKGLWYLLEDEFKDVQKAGAEKRAEMNKRLLELFPTLTQTELDAINKHVHTLITEQATANGLLEPVEK